MIRLIFFLLLMYFAYRIVKYFFRVFLKNQRSPEIYHEKREIIDVDYEEIKEDEKSSK